MSEEQNNNNKSSSQKKNKNENVSFSLATPLVEGQDFYMEDGLFVLTAYYLNKRGYCCGNGCRHCPYGAINGER